MPVIHLEAQISTDELVAAAGQLGHSEMDELMDKLLTLRAQRRAPSLPAEEASLLAEINRGVPAALRDRFDVLVERRRAGTLTAEEHAELVSLTDQIEAADAERLSRLARLAQLRSVSFDALLQSLGVQMPNHV
jgi:hypothetical protein